MIAHLLNTGATSVFGAVCFRAEALFLELNLCGKEIKLLVSCFIVVSNYSAGPNIRLWPVSKNQLHHNIVSVGTIGL